MKQKDKKELFIKKANATHNGFYCYDKVNYVDSQTKVCIICPEHGEFWQTPSAHIRGNKCPICANESRGRYKRMTLEEFVEKSNKVHNGKYIYKNTSYKNVKEKVLIICPEHGEFWQTPLAHLSGKGCPKCAHKGLNDEELVKEFRKVHGDKYDYSKTVLKKMNEKVIIICPEHGEFLQSPTKHLAGQGCPKCAADKVSKEKIMDTAEFIEKANGIHQNKYDYSKTIYTGTYNQVKIICPKHGEFMQRANDHLSGHGCPHCGNNMSSAETEIISFIESLGLSVESRNRTILPNGKEIDILIPEKGVGIEYDGLLWHSDKYKNKDYHLRKTEECADSGIRLIHVFEDEWVNKRDIVKSMLSNILGMTERRIFARKCHIKEISWKDSSEFISKNHIQGRTASKINIGLFYGDELVSVMTFGKPRLSLGHKKKTYDYELIRFCNKLNTSVVGAAGKLMSYFVKHYSPWSIVSYCDRRWSNGNMYEKLGFTLDHTSKPNYFYVDGCNRKNRFRYHKAALVRMGYDVEKSESEITKEIGLSRIYDCGTFVYVWKREDV